MNSPTDWLQLLMSYGLTVVIESPILMVALSWAHPWRHRLFAGVWLTSCSYPVIALVLPYFISTAESWPTYVVAAEVFAPVFECFLFWLVFDRPRTCARAMLGRDFGAIIVANLTSFGLGTLLSGWLWG